MVRFEETSQFNRGNLFLMGLSVIALMVWMGIEIQSYIAGRPSFLGIAYIGLFCGLLLWRYAVRYTYALTKQELIITSQCLSFSRTYRVTLDSLESYSNQYKGSIFKHRGISRLVHRYSSADGRATRILMFRDKGKACGLLLKVSDKFMNEVKALHPNIYETM